MPLEDDVIAFQDWAIKLGCPPQAMPSQDALKSVFKSRQRDIFVNMMQRVRPHEEVQAVIENILIHKMQKQGDQVVPTCNRNFLPKEMQTYLKVKDLKQCRLEIEQRIEEHKREYDTLAGSIKAKNIQMMSLENKEHQLRDRVNLLESKSAALDKDIKKEEQIKVQIVATMPVKLTAKNAKENLATEAVESALKELDAYYNFCNNNNNPHQLQEAKDELWRKIRSIFANTPNFMFFNEIMRRKEQQLHQIMSLNKSNVDETLHSACSLVRSAGVGKEPFTPFEIRLMKSKVDLLGLVAKYLSARSERIALEERFYGAYLTFIDELQKKVKLFNAANSDETIDKIISDYVVRFNVCNFSKSQNEFIAQQIELIKADFEANAKKLENHEVLLGSVKQVYGEIHASINRIQHEMQQLGQIKEKIVYSRSMMKHMLDTELQSAGGGVKSNFHKVSGNTSGGDSFDAELMLCSTKLDFDGSMSLNNTTIMRRSFSTADGGGGGNTPHLPPFVQELYAFAQLPMEKFSCVPKECAFYLLANPLVIESRELISSTVQLAPGILLTPFGALQEVRERIAWSKAIDEHSNTLKSDIELIIIDPQSLRQKTKQQREQIAELLDKIDVTAINTKHMLQKARKLFEFLEENPLGRYIPALKTFNNLTFAEFQAEFTMYYRMATVGTSITSK